MLNHSHLEWEHEEALNCFLIQTFQIWETILKNNQRWSQKFPSKDVHHSIIFNDEMKLASVSKIWLNNYGTFVQEKATPT